MGMECMRFGSFQEHCIFSADCACIGIEVRHWEALLCSNHYTDSSCTSFGVLGVGTVSSLGIKSIVSSD